MWEHSGKCVCGKKSYLFGQCSKCFREEQFLRQELTDREEAMVTTVDELLKPGIPELAEALEEVGSGGVGISPTDQA